MMKTSVLIAALAVASSFAMPHSDSKDRVKDLVEAATEYVQAVYEDLEDPIPVHFRLTSDKPQLGGLIKANLTIPKGQYYGFSYFIVDNVVTDPENLKAKVHIMLPDWGILGKYAINGEAFGKQVHGKGKFHIKAVNYTFNLDNIQFEETENKALRITSFGLSFDIADIPLMTTGLKVEGMTVVDFEKMVDDTLTTVADKTSGGAKDFETFYIDLLNKAIGDKTLEEVVDYLRNNKPSHEAQHMFTMLANSFAHLV